VADFISWFLVTSELTMSESSPNSSRVAWGRGGPIPPGWVKVVTYGSATEAELYSGILAAQGINSQVFGANTNAVDWFWQGFNDVDLLVQEGEVEQAKDLLSKAPGDGLEPAEEPKGAPPAADEAGNSLLPVGAFENIRRMRDAQAVLASARIDAYGPRLVLRGDRAAGVGKRFILRVAEKDLESARSVLAEEADEDRDEPRCPKCGSWSVIPRNVVLGGLAKMMGLNELAQFECSSCNYRGGAAEFLNHDGE
jgi:hypothetical protein